MPSLIESALFRSLEEQLLSHLTTSAPLTKDEQARLEAMAKWTQESVKVAQQAQQLAAQRRTLEAQTLLDAHNAARPRRRPGRPTRRVPNIGKLRYALLYALAELGLPKIEEDPKQLRRVLSVASSQLYLDVK